ncbi:DUF5677 domain-containing protein [Marispirochaeta sp.]|uniref:DUF5677 domain-containing protein n=1 Tax=Marispirochaeta sp. TaxID=2038653 RepID=UPI0029C6285A|nr:DUF5677 domain-containing protein [Marispirochaeta sp.]
MKVYDWNWFRERITEFLKTNSTKHLNFLKYIEDIDSILQEALNQKISPVSSRPHDYLACITMTRCFRLLISGLSLILSGFPECASNLDRSIWEIGIRLSYINEKDPIGGAFGWILSSYESDIKMLKAEYEYRIQKNDDFGNLLTNLQSKEKELKAIEEKMGEMNLDPTKMKNKFGSISIGNICDNLNIRKAYDVSYNFLSGFVHEQLKATDDITFKKDDRLFFSLGPNEMNLMETKAQIFDIIQDTLIVIGTGNELLEKNSLSKRVNELLDDLSKQDILN